MSQKLSIDGFKWRNDIFNKKFIKNYDKNNDKRCKRDSDAKHPKNLHYSHSG